MFVPLASSCPNLAADEIRCGLVGSPWLDVTVDTSAVLIGIQVGPRGGCNAATTALRKFAVRSREIANLGLPPEASLALANVLATPVLHHVGQFHPLPAGADAVAQIATQGLLHLPHHGFGRPILRSLRVIVLPDFVPVDLAVRGLALSAARRYDPYSSACVARLAAAFASSELRPLASLASRASAETEGFIPIGWVGPAFAATLAANANTLRSLGASRLKGTALCRAIEPLCSARTFARELLRRLSLWAPIAYRRSFSASDFEVYLPTLSLAANRDKLAWLRLVQNAWTTRGRFSHTYSACLVCGDGAGDRLSHIILCRPFWRPVFLRAGLDGGCCSLRRLLLSPPSAAIAGIGFRAHAALRGLPSLSPQAWADQVSASAR